MQTPEEEIALSMQEFFKKCLSHWKLFLISVFLFCAVGAWYGLSQEPIYKRSMEILVKDQEGGASIGDLSSAFSSLGLSSANTNVNNELISFLSPAVLYEVIEDLGLDVNYATPSRFYDRTLYGTNLPYIVEFKDLDEQESAGFKITHGNSGELILNKFYRFTPEGREAYDKEIKIKPGPDAIQTPLGRVVVKTSAKFDPAKAKGKNGYEGTPIFVDRNGMQATLETYTGKINGDLVDKDADVIELTMKDQSVQRAVDVLNTILNVYNRNWVEDKNKIAVATSKFIDDRLVSIQKELTEVETDISKYKSENLVPDVREVAKLQIQENSEMSAKMLETTNQISMATYLRDYLNNPANANSVLPVNTGIASPTLETEISAYNNILLNRNNLAANSSDNNPIVQGYDTQLEGLRRSIIAAVDGEISSLGKVLKNMSGMQGNVKNQLASAPVQANYLLSLERQQVIKQELYMFLLQKKEENDLSQKFTADNVRVITPPMGSLLQISPKKKLIVGVMFLLGLLFPAIWIYIRMSTDTKIRSRKDLDGLSAPFAGEIPFVGKNGIRERFATLLHSNKKPSSSKLESVVSVVKPGSRDAVSESFRIMRGNLDFMNHRKGESNVILLTSFNPGSGKSFISYNLSASFALKGKKVLLVDGDLRHGSVSQFVNMPSKGLTNYLTGNTDDWKQFVTAVPEHQNMYIMPIGHRPPNPAELIESGRMGEFIKEARNDYDYILIDCPPTDVVIDTRLMEQYADSTVFVIRAGLLDKKQIAEIDGIYTRKEFKNMSIVLNATTDGAQRKTYGAYGYYSND